MVERRISEAAKAMNGELIGDPSAVFRGVAIDSRALAGGELFFALAGSRSDGHLFVDQALQSGAAGAVVERWSGDSPDSGAIVRVEDSVLALRALTEQVRRDFPQKIVGVTGSAGKTTAKELLSAMLATHRRTGASPGNLNNLLGFPLALLGLADEIEWMVAEMGMSEPGEMAELSRLVRPDAMLLLNVKSAHIERFDSLQAIAEAKADSLVGMAPGSLVVFNADDPELLRIGSRIQADGRFEMVWFSLSGSAPGSCPLRVEELELTADGEPGSRFVLSDGSRRSAVSLSLAGRHNVENFLGAATLAVALGCDLKALADAGSRVLPQPMRGVVHRRPDGGRVWDDSYNSNPDAVAAALQAAAGVGAKRRWAVLGAMLELGRDSAAFHREAGRLAAELGFSPILGVGEEALPLVGAAREAGAEAHWFATAGEAAHAASEEMRGDDLVLIKGSRGIALEAVTRAVLGDAN